MAEWRCFERQKTRLVIFDTVEGVSSCTSSGVSELVELRLSLMAALIVNCKVRVEMIWGLFGL